MKQVFILLLCLLTLANCATQGKSVALGGGIGAGTGLAIGAIADPNATGEFRTRNVIIGGALGGIAGMVAGQAIYNGQEKAKTDGAKLAASAPLPAENQPNLSQPKVESRWVEPKVSGNRYIEGHFEYIITEPARWQP